jgi:hypothetical protein
LEHKIHREASDIVLDGLNKCAGYHAIQGGKILIEQDALAAQDKDRAGDVPDGNQGLGLRHGASPGTKKNSYRDGKSAKSCKKSTSGNGE